MEVPKDYEPESVEPRWQRRWSDSDIYSFRGEEPVYTIDTPPPYPTGSFHIGNALGWCYMDFTARYKRMRGYDVLFPQGWDCHGLPTEVKVEERHGISKNDVSSARFRELCEELTEENIASMKETMEALGFSQDWDHEYVTMSPEYYEKTQRSFVEMVRSGDVYKAKHPVNWCPRCRTAIADAEVEHEHRGTVLNYFYFEGDEDRLPIASTRPELLPACVGVVVNPEDERYEKFVGKKVTVPVFGQEVEVFSDEEADPDFGTGAVMVCTFGDKQDVEWWAEHDLDLREALTRGGRMKTLAGEFEGLTLEEAKEAIAERLDEEGLLFKQEEVEQHVGICWRCDTPVEILSTEQWFVDIDEDEILESAREIKWVPGHMRKKLEAWTEKVGWDWCVSRQRIFATPIPVWYCRKCGEPLVPEPDSLPLNPLEDEPPGPCECGSTDLEPEDDVFDTWMDSSISALHIGGWPDEFRVTDLRQQGHEIIRTWAFYTILRAAALEDEIPWRTALINGMVLGSDGNKMSKSRGNYVQPEEVLEDYSADAFRLWGASGGTPGSDIPYDEKEVRAGSRFMRKVWNIFRFSLPHFSERKGRLEEMDRWILSRLNGTLKTVERAMDEFRFDDALKCLRDFSWDDLADDYLELVKYRLYDEETAPAAGWTLFRCVDSLVRGLAPFTPHLSEEIFDHYGEGSVHRQEYPAADTSMVDESVEEGYGEVVQVVRRVRRYKSDEGMPLNAPIRRLKLFGANSALKENSEDVERTLHVEEFSLEEGEPEVEERPVSVDVDYSILGPALKDAAGPVGESLEEADPAKVSDMQERAEVKVELNGESVTVPVEAVNIVERPVSSGREVEVLEAGDVTLLLSRK